MKYIFFSLCLALSLNSCKHETNSSGQWDNQEASENPDQKAYVLENMIEEKIAAKTKADDFSAKNAAFFLLENKSQKPKKLELEQYEKHPRVQKWLKYYTGRGRRQLQQHLDQGHYYKDTVIKLLKQEELPTEFYYLALIESGFRTSARSHASAVGVWQFIKNTGTRYGLRINNYVDERMDPIRSTLAASSYLRDLHNVFHSWFLALSAYNTGESRILNLIFRHKTRNYWQLSIERGFPRETRNYVPKFIAAYLVGSNLEKYGFKEPNSDKMPELISVAVPSPVRVKEIAKKAKVPLKSIYKHNPNLITHITPSYLKSYRLWFERPSSSQQLLSDLKSLKTLKQQYAANFYRIRKGDNLIKIAKKFGITVSSLKRLNRMRSNRIIVGRKLRISSGGSYYANSKTILPGHYRIRKGDSLIKIAKNFGLTVKKLKKLNHLTSSRLIAGRQIRISEIADISLHGKKSKCCQLTNHTVKKGDSLYSLARKYNISVKALKRLNSLRSSNIRIGQEIKIKR